MALLHSTSFYYDSASLHFTQLTLPWLYFTVLDSTLLYAMALLHSSSPYSTLHLINFTLFHSTLLYHGSTALQVTLHDITLALLNSISPHIILP